MAKTYSAGQVEKAFGILASDKAGRKEIRKTYRTVGKLGVGLARAEMRRGDRQLAAVAGRLRGTGSTTGARISVPRGRPAAAVYGTEKRTGWLGNARHRTTTARNNPPWVGSTWRVATKGEGPRGVNDALADGQDKIVKEFEKAATETINRAFR